MNDSADLIRIFNDIFKATENTILVGGLEEPLYLPAHANPKDTYHRIYFRQDYFASALHEVAHWCIAGEKRRQLEDYGYWYKPDGRDHAWQALFEESEAKPQALESIFSSAANFPFQISVDNLMNPTADNQVFRRKVEHQIVIFHQNGLPQRARLFHEALLKFYAIPPM